MPTKRNRKMKPDDYELTVRFSDPQSQKGISWRQAMLATAIEARDQGWSDDMILARMILGGVSTQRARELLGTLSWAQSVLSREGAHKDEKIAGAIKAAARDPFKPDDLDKAVELVEKRKQEEAK